MGADSIYDAKQKASAAAAGTPFGQASGAPAATPQQTKTFTTGVDKAQADFNKSLAEAKKTLDMGVKAKNQFVIDSAKNLINTLNTVVKPSLAILQKAENPNATYTGDITPINKALGGGAPGSGPSGIVLGSGGKGAYTLEQIRAYMDANNGSFPPDLNTIASGITAADLTNLVNQYESGGVGPKTNITPLTGTGGISAERRDAFSIIKSTLTTYGFTEAEIAELSTFIESGLTNAKMGPEQLKLDMRELPTYKARFAGNTTRISAGLNALSESDYLQQENDYSEIFKMYGVGNLSSRAQFSSLIGGNISVTEVTKRVDAAVKRVKNGDPAVLTTLRTLYPNITDTDIVSYFLKPGEMLPELERKTTVAEIGATAGQFGMKETGLAKFEDLQRYGVTLASARAGYSTIAEELPGATKLGNVYGETGITYGQTEAEAEQFKSSAEAKRKKEKLIETEKSSFKGSAGLNTGGLSTQYLRRSSSAGQF